MHRDTKTAVFFVALGKKHNRSVGKVPVNMHFFIHIIILINSTNAFLFLFCHVSRSARYSLKRTNVFDRGKCTVSQDVKLERIIMISMLFIVLLPIFLFVMSI